MQSASDAVQRHAESTSHCCNQETTVNQVCPSCVCVCVSQLSINLLFKFNVQQIEDIMVDKIALKGNVHASLTLILS